VALGKTGIREAVRPRALLFQGQPGDLFLSKISAMVIDIGDLDENGDIHVTKSSIV